MLREACRFRSKIAVNALFDDVVQLRPCSAARPVFFRLNEAVLLYGGDVAKRIQALCS